MELSRLLGSERGQVLGSAPLLEKAISKEFCHEPKMEFCEDEPMALADYAEKRRKEHNDKVDKKRCIAVFEQ
jgi:hypothetical protein